MTAAICNTTDSRQYTPTDAKQFHYVDKIVIEERDAVDYEACYYYISVEDEKYYDDTGAYIELQLETLDNALAYIYDGTGRGNATAFIEGNSTAPLGAPYRAPISSKIILVVTTAPNGMAGSVSFSYQLFDAEEYPFYYKPFVGVNDAAWYFTLSGVLLLPFIIFGICLCTCMYCRCCQRCCSFCMISSCCRFPEEPKEQEKVKKNQVNVSHDENDAPG